LDGRGTPQLHRTTSYSRVSSYGGSTADHDYTAGSPSRAPVGTGYGMATRVTMRVVVTTPLTVSLSLASDPEPSPLAGILTGMLLWSDTSVMELTRLSVWWKGSDD
jgi:hypothetical protein